MFSRIPRMKITRWIASLLIVTFTLTAVYFDMPVTALSKKPVLQLGIAAVGIENLTKYKVLQSDHGVSMLLAEIGGMENVNIVPQERVLQSLGRLEPNPDVAISVGKAVGADAALVGFISDLKFQGTEQAEVQVGLSLYRVEDGSLLSEAVVVGRSSRLGFSGSQQELAELAIRDGVRTASGFLFENLNAFGVVTLVKDNQVFCSLAERNNVRVGAEIAVFKHGTNTQIASLEVVDVSVAHSVGKIVEQQTGAPITMGDEVRLVYTPVVMEITGGVKPIPKKKKFSPLILGALAIGVIAAVSRGGNKAEPPNPSNGAAVVASRDGYAAVYSPTPFNAAYIPAPPEKIQPAGILATSLGACWSSNTYINPLQDTAYNFFLSSSPKNTTLPGNGYTIAFDVARLFNATGGYTLDQTTKLKCATCNADLGQWEILSGTYQKVSYLNNDYGVTCRASHFTPYLVVIDNRISPQPAPTNFSVDCGDQKALLSWDPLTGANNTNYVIYNCTSTACSSVRDTLDKTQTSVNYTVPNGTQVCFAVSGKSSIPEQDSTISDIKCTTPSSDPALCQVHAITLVSPGSGTNITTIPNFIFIGSGNMDFYMVEVEDTSTGYKVMSFQEAGEGAAATTGRATYSVTYSGSTLSTGKEYRWQVTGHQNNGATLESSQWTFVYQGSGATECGPMTTTPDDVSPSNGALVQADNPLLIWKSVSNATQYLVTVYNTNGEVVSDIALQDGTSTKYAGSPLLNDMDYQWTVSATNGSGSGPTCGQWVMGTNPFTFKKVSLTTNSLLPIPQWATTEGRVALTKGDHLVSLNWERLDDSTVLGYAIYRYQTITDTPTLIATILKTQLGSPNADANCPKQFSQNDPGYCDPSVTNGEKYYYWVAATGSGNSVGNKSVVQGIQLDLPRPSLIAPGDVTATNVTTSSPTFLWFPVIGNNISYYLKLIDDSTNLVLWEPTVTDTMIQYPAPVTPPTVPALENGKTYRWTVMAFNPSVQSPESSPFRFTKIESSTKPDPVNFCGGAGNYCSPQQSNPDDINYTNNSITLYWQMPTSSNIDYYKIYRCQDVPGICKTPVSTTGNFPCSATKTNVVCYTDTGLDRGSTYYYIVTAVDKSGMESDPSQTLPVTTQLKGPALMFPVYDSVVYVPQPTFTWYGEPGATEYLVQVVKKPDLFSNPANFVWSFRFSSSGSGVTTATFNSDNSAKSPLLNPSDPSISGNQYQWRVCSINVRNQTPVCSNPSEFYKNLKPPTTLSPASGDKIATNNITFRWTETPGATGYTLRVCHRVGTGSNCSELPVAYQNDDVTGSSITVDVSQWDKCDLASDPSCALKGSYFWEIRAFDQYGSVSGSWDNVNRELFYLVFADVPQLIKPFDGEIVSPDPSCVRIDTLYGFMTYSYGINFEWVDLGQGPYTIRIEDIEASDDASNPNDPKIVVVFDGPTNNATNFNVGGCTTGNNVISLAAGHRHRWNIAGASMPYAPANAKEFVTGLPYPRLLAPLNGQQVLLQDNCDQQSSTLCLHFDWDGGQWKNVDTGNMDIYPGVIGAISYDVEILKNGGLPFLCEPKFTYDPANPPVPPYTNTTNTFCDLSTNGISAVNGDVFTWRVRSRDNTGEQTQSGTGNPSPWTQFNQFTVLIPKVVLATPPNSPTCDPVNSPSTISTSCTTVDCMDASYYWSPIPAAFGKSCYRIEISDTQDFRNLIWSDTTEAPVNSFPCALNQCYTAGTAEGQYIPMTNGVVYYWRVGASVVPSGGGSCGFTWIYSDTWEYYKRPPIPQNVRATPVDSYNVTLSWDPPVNCTSSSGQALSVPSVPPEGGEYLVYVMDQNGQIPNPTTDSPRLIVGASTVSVNLSSLAAATNYTMCVAISDNSFYINHPGNVSDPVCVSVSTPAAPTTKIMPGFGGPEQ